MAVNMKTLAHYASVQDWRRIPDPLQALGEITCPDGKRLLSIAFSTGRDIITAIGYGVEASCPAPLKACAAAVCELARGKAVMAAELLGPDDIAAVLADDGILEDEVYYAAVLATLALKNAVSSYASYRSSDLKAWKAEQPG